jgi:hypothetical protein
MKLTKQQKRVLARALEAASNLAFAHAAAVKNVEGRFEQFFGESVPEECFSGFSNHKEDVGALVNNFINYSENMAGPNWDTAVLVNKIEELMNAPEE